MPSTHPPLTACKGSPQPLLRVTANGSSDETHEVVQKT